MLGMLRIKLLWKGETYFTDIMQCYECYEPYKHNNVVKRLLPGKDLDFITSKEICIMIDCYHNIFGLEQFNLAHYYSNLIIEFDLHRCLLFVIRVELMP